MSNQGGGQGMPPQNAGPKRFSEGEEVFARLQTGWEKAKILPLDNPGAAYKMEVVSSGDMIYSPADYDLFVRHALPSAEEELVMQGQIQQMQQKMQGGSGMQQQMQGHANAGPKRFKTGDTVFARLANGWEEATVLENDNPATSYKIQVTSSGESVYAPADADLYVRSTLPNAEDEKEMQEQIVQMKQKMQQMSQMQQHQMQQQGMQRVQNNEGSMIERGATVPDGPLAMEQVFLVKMITEHRSHAMDAAAKSVMNKMQIKTLAKAFDKAKQCDDKGRAMNIIQKAQNEVQSQLSNDQKMKISQRAQEKMEEVNEQILAPQEEAWLSNLNEEQRKVWDDTRKVADNAEPQIRMQLIRRGQLKVGKMLSEEQQASMAAGMKEIREKFMSSFLKSEVDQAEKDAADDEDAAAQMMEQMMNMGC